MQINWRERGLAALIHFGVTLALSGIAAGIIFFVWFPDSLATLVGGTTLFLMVLGVDLALGPLISLVIYSSAKPRRELIIDYTVVGIVQVAALIYGMYAVAVSRPVFVGFFVDQLEIVTAVELAESDLKEGGKFGSLSWTGPKLVAMTLPADTEERNRIMFSAVGGKDANLMPKYYQPYESVKADVTSHAKSLDALRPLSPAEQSELDRAIAKAGPRESLRWLPARHRFGFGIALLDSRFMEPVQYVKLNPFGDELAIPKQ